jgi:glycerate kinase
MRIVVAPDKFKGTASALELTAALAAALRVAGHEVISLPLADGGEGFLDVFGGPNRTTTVDGPLGDEVEAAWRLDRGTAVIEMARASGLTLVGGAEGTDPIAASTYGVGELIATAVESGARRVLVGVGGSATTDGGLGALRALHPPQRLRGVELLVACDVRTRFVDAATVFAPQKGATRAQVELLRRRLERLAQVFVSESGVDVLDLEGGGAAGGLAGGLATIGARLFSGFELVAEEVGLDQSIEGADMVITGEGFLDGESFEGKVVGGVAALAAELGVGCVALVGEVVDPLPALPEGLQVLAMVDRFGVERAMADPCGCAVELVLEAVAGMA